MNKRLRAREIAVEVTYQLDVRRETDFSALLAYYDEPYDKAYTVDLLSKLIAAKEEIDIMISTYLKKWTIDRIPKLERAILEVAITEIKYMDDIPIKVSISQALNLTSKYSDEQSTKFINGLLKNFVETP